MSSATPASAAVNARRSVDIGDERVELLELIDEQQQLAVRRARALAQQRAEVAGLGAQALDRLRVLDHLLLRVGAAPRGQALHDARERRERLATRAAA